MTAPSTWLRRRDPGLLTVRRAARVTLVACGGFYFCRYGLDNPVMAPYALFGAVALGMLSQIPGSPRQRARTLLAVLPVGWLLVTLGTLLSVDDRAAAAGMFVLGFTVSFVGVGGPRLVGLAAGLQLLYILPCFPPYDPGSLGYRLAGVTLAAVLLAGAELVLWPDPTPIPYRRRLADAVGGLAGCLAALAATWSGDPHRRDRLAALLPDATDAAAAIRPSHLPIGERPASASRPDRALTSAAGTARLILGRTADLYRTDDTDAITLPAAAALLRQTASCAEAAAMWLRGEGPVPDTDRILAALEDFRIARMNTSPNGIPADRLRLGSLALSLGSGRSRWSPRSGSRRARRSTRTARRRPPSRGSSGTRTRAPRPCGGTGSANISPPARSPSRARCAWPPRSRSGAWWPGCWPVARLLGAADHPDRAPRVGRRDPVHPETGADRHHRRLGRCRRAAAGRRGSACLRDHPAAGHADRLRGRAADRARLGAGAVHARHRDGLRPGRAGGLAARRGPGAGRAPGRGHRAADRAVRLAARRGRRAAPGGRLAEASYALYQSEGRQPAGVDWQATLAAGYHALHGAEAILRSCPSGGLLPCVGPLTAAAEDVSARFDRVALGLLRDDRAAIRDAAPLPTGLRWPDDLGQDLYHLADLRVWLDGLRDDLTRITAPADDHRPVAASGR